MKVTDVGRYKLSFNSKHFSVECPLGTAKFSGLATSALPKLYVVSANNNPLYVGITKQSMRNRLRLGWSANGDRGYYGYAWRHNFSEANLDVWAQTDSASNNNCLDVETIEAELVYLIRRKGQWPLFQTEIHFHASSDMHRAWAAKIGARYGIAP